MERVVVTGMGLVTPCGLGNAPTLTALMEGRSGVGPIRAFDATEDFATRFAAEVDGFEPTDFVPKKKLKETSRFIQFALAASKLAVEDAGLDLTDEERERTGCFIGVGLGGLDRFAEVSYALRDKGPRKVSPYFIPTIIGNLAAGQVTIAHGLRGPSYCHTSACTSSAHAIGEAYEWIRSGRTDVMLAGGAEATITPVGIAGFNAMFALSRRNDEPQKASRPFDRGRDGFVVGEGSGVLILEKLSRAKQRGANILAEIAGWGATSDATHITKPAEGHRYAANAMRIALDTAKRNPDDIGYINAHATSTPAGDTEESHAIERVFGAHARDHRLWISSTKSMMGHLLGAAGAVEAAICVNAIRTGAIPPTINLEDPDPECTLDYVANQGRQRVTKYAMSNSFGFGGTNAAIVFSAFEG
jgi:3-oxoacyl-[acyl-carrier-protein] synthase II